MTWTDGETACDHARGNKDKFVFSHCSQQTHAFTFYLESTPEPNWPAVMCIIHLFHFINHRPLDLWKSAFQLEFYKRLCFNCAQQLEHRERQTCHNWNALWIRLQVDFMALSKHCQLSIKLNAHRSECCRCEWTECTHVAEPSIIRTTWRLLILQRTCDKWQETRRLLSITQRRELSNKQPWWFVTKAHENGSSHAATAQNGSFYYRRWIWSANKVSDGIASNRIRNKS